MCAITSINARTVPLFTVNLEDQNDIGLDNESNFGLYSLQQHERTLYLIPTTTLQCLLIRQIRSFYFRLILVFTRQIL